MRAWNRLSLSTQAFIGLLMGIDRLRDLFTTMTNVLIQATTEAVTAIFAGETLTLRVAGEESEAAASH